MKLKEQKADSGAVPVIRKAKRRSRISAGMARERSRITANTGWARRSSAKVPNSPKQPGDAAQVKWDADADWSHGPRFVSRLHPISP